MECPHCAFRHMNELGCTVSFRPFHWCPSCGAIRTCEGIVATPYVTHEWDKLRRQMNANKPGNR